MYRRNWAKPQLAWRARCIGAANPCPLTEMRQILQRNRPLRAFGFGNKLFADPMVRVFLEPLLPPRQPVEAAFGRFRADRLECGAPRVAYHWRRRSMGAPANTSRHYRWQD